MRVKMQPLNYTLMLTLIDKRVGFQPRYFKPYLDDLDVRDAIRSVPAAVHLDVLQPLNVRLRITVDLTMELGIPSDHGCCVGW